MSNLLEKLKKISGIKADAQIVLGASDMIKQLAEEEEKIIQMQIQHLKPVQKVLPPKTDIASILSKYVSKDLNKDAYKFIKLNPNLCYNEVQTRL